MAARKFIAGAIRRPGQLHRDLGVPQGEKIPVERVRFAVTLSKLRKGGRGARTRAARSA